MWRIVREIVRVGIATEPAPWPAADHPQATAPHLADEVPAGAEAAAEAGRIQQELLAILGHALAIRHVDAGSCNGCELEIHALANPYYNLEGLGLRFVASPRHADLLLVTGPVTRHMAGALRRTWEATPEPRLVVAVGDCGCTGGVFGENYASLGPVERVLPVDARIPGCPPPPIELLRGILAVVQRRR